MISISPVIWEKPTGLQIDWSTIDDLITLATGGKLHTTVNVTTGPPTPWWLSPPFLMAAVAAAVLYVATRRS